MTCSQEEDAGIARFRFVVPADCLCGRVPVADIVDDLQFVCDRVIVPALQKATAERS
jgi:hypothetical protein